jgi:hypothetical protein
MPKFVNMKILSISPMTAGATAAAIVCMTLVAPMDEAQAGTSFTMYGRQLNAIGPDVRVAASKPNQAAWTATGTKIIPKPEVRDHRGQPQVLAPPVTCSRYPHRPGCSRPWGLERGATVRDHRGRHVVPKEDPRQK